MKDIIELAEESQNRAWEVIRDAKIIDAWASIGATVNLVGLLKTGLLIKHLDIDTDKWRLFDGLQNTTCSDTTT